MKFYTGQKVKVKKYTDMPWDGGRAGQVSGIGLNSPMKSLCGSIATIATVETSGLYRLAEDKNWVWAEEMLEHLFDIPSPFSIGCLVSSNMFDVAVIKDAEEHLAVCAVLASGDKEAYSVAVAWSELSLIEEESAFSLWR